MVSILRAVGRWWLLAVVALAVAAGCTVAPVENEPLPVLPERQPQEEDAPVDVPTPTTCTDACSLGFAECDSTEAARVCEDDGAGCPRWTTKTCRPGSTCLGAPDNCLGEAPVCTDECPAEGAKKCEDDSTAGVLECKRGTNGCLAWSPGASCAGNSSCDRAKNDGTCKAGCTNDVGCDASKNGATRCSSTGRSSQRCEKDAASSCYRWKIEQLVPQDCTGTGPYSCSGASAKKVCTTRQIGACTAHESKVEACSAGATCSGAGVCKVVCPPSDGCGPTTLYKSRCKAGTTTGRQVCIKNAAGCYVWSDTSACAGGKTCDAGLCKCTGCMSGATCVTGTSKTACGADGAACKDCNAYCSGFGRVAQSCSIANRVCVCSQAF